MKGAMKMKIVVGGQISKQEIHDFINDYLQGKAQLAVKNDLDAVNAVKMGQFDYYIGACNTGGGGALAMALALLGKDKCKTISMPGKIFPDEEIVKAVEEGKIAFGFTAQDYRQVLPVLLDAMNRKMGI